MPTIKKVLNSSVVLVLDENNQETIILDKGVGYGKKPGEEIKLSNTSQIFIPYNQDEKNKLIELIESISPDYLKVTNDIVSYAEKELNTKLNNHIYLALADHLSFAIDRINKGMVLTNRVFWEIKTFYPKEFNIGLYGIKSVFDNLSVLLPEEEAANIAFHIVNASKAEGQADAIRASKIIKQIVTIVTFSMQIEIDKNSIHYSRFISHIQFFTQRFFLDKLLDSDDNSLYEHLSLKCPKEIECAERIRTYLIKEYNKVVTDEEVAYLAIHINRLVS